MEILFKAKRIDTGNWIEGFYCEWYDFKCNKQYQIISSVGHHNDIDKKTLCQFTGMFDKKNNRIWENDIVESKNIHNEFIGKSLVERLSNKKDFNYNGFVFLVIDSHNKENIGKHSSFSPNSIWWTNDEPSNFDLVIGNKFDNPELLNVAQHSI